MSSNGPGCEFGDWHWHKLLSVSPNYTKLTCRNYIFQHSAITETTINQRSFAFILLEFQQLNRGINGLICISDIFSALKTHVTHRIPSLFQIPTSFVNRGPISMLSNRPCHGPCTSLWDSGTNNSAMLCSLPWRYCPFRTLATRTDTFPRTSMI